MYKRKILEEEIRRKCGKVVILSEIEEKEAEYLQGEENGNESIIEKELSFDDILVKKHPKHAAKKQFIDFIYHDLFQYFVTQQHEHNLQKEFTSSYIREKTDEIVQNENKGEEELENIEKVSFDKEDFIQDKTNIFYSKSTLKDECVHFSFVNGNSYFGCANKKRIEGEGLYKWHHGVQYKGQFKQSQIHGTGTLEWQSNCWYEGKFLKGYRHGKGTLIDKDYHRLYIGEWYMGYRHGKGYCHYAPTDSYDGEWSMGKKDGIGFYIYPNGVQYKGYWKNDHRHGNGMMAWPNGDVYHGEWKYGNIHGYGEYIWHSFYNKSLSWPQNISYIGNWHCNTRHGRELFLIGLLKLNSVGGAKYLGHWKHNKKHGAGMIIGNNGELVKGDPLYTKDILAPLCVDKLSKLLEPCKTTILKPEQFPSMSYHINRLMKLSLTIKSPVHSVSMGKCYICNEQQSCSCLLESLSKATSDTNIRKKEFYIKWEYEKNQINDYLTLHMSRIWHVYNIYAKLFNKTEIKYHLVMVRLTLWQLLRDCKLTIKGLGLNDIDDYIGENESCFLKKLHHPFEKIEIWQFLHVLIEVSWRLYYWKNDEAKKNRHWTHGILATCLHKFLIHDVYPNVGSFVGLVPHECHHLLPIYSVYELYKQIEYPQTAINILTASIKDDKIHISTFHTSPITLTVPENILNGVNCVTIGNKINFLPSENKFFLETKMQTIMKQQSNGTNNLLVFKELGPTKIIEIMAKVCPSIKDNDSNIILNMNYTFTFLEFYEIILEAAKCTIKSRNIKKDQDIASTLNIELTPNNSF